MLKWIQLQLDPEIFNGIITKGQLLKFCGGKSAVDTASQSPSLLSPWIIMFYSGHLFHCTGQAQSPASPHSNLYARSHVAFNTYGVSGWSQFVERLNVEPRALVAGWVQCDAHRVLLQQRRQSLVHRQILVTLQMQQLQPPATKYWLNTQSKPEGHWTAHIFDNGWAIPTGAPWVGVTAILKVTNTKRQKSKSAKLRINNRKKTQT